MRKPELFKMACLRDILRLFPSGTQEAFYAGFGNRITDAMSYRSVGIPASKIYTIDSTGVVKTELLQAAGHKGSYIQLVSLGMEAWLIVERSRQRGISSSQHQIQARIHRLQLLAVDHT
jgi:phosphatidate phosphatase LPIN